MEFGISCSKVSEVGLISHAENLGYAFCWATDSPMLRSHPFTVLALAARETQRIRLGTGVAVPGLRVAPDLANAIATINRLAPGRTFLGIGTGNTAMRTLGRPPVKVAPFARYIRTVRGLLAGEEVALEHEGHPRAVRFQNLEGGYVDIAPEIPIHVGGFGPKAQALAGEIGDGLITGIPRGGTLTRALDNVRAGAERGGRDLSGFYVTALVNLALLEPGEPLDSPRVVAEVGSSVMVNVHYHYERYREVGEPPPEHLLPIWEDYLAFQRRRAGARQHQVLHQSHYSSLDPEEARFVTPEMIERFSLAGEPDRVTERLRGLEAEGLNAIVFIPRDDRKYRAYEDFAREVIPRMREG